MIDQTRIPFQVDIYTCSTYKETAQAIEKMIIRGAPSIGAAGGFGLAQAVLEFWNREDFEEKLQNAYIILLASRPTAVDLKNGLNFVKKTSPMSPDNALRQAQYFSNQIAEEGRRLGQIGKELIKTGMNILTHCHTGALALVDHGSAIAPIIYAWVEDKKRFHVYVDETRPRFQGRITSWELSQYEINHTVICDSASGYLMSQEKVDLIILGADRVVANGDIANKIGTYNLAILAQYHEIPFYTAFPTSTFDPNTKRGNEILIEERGKDEIYKAWGYSNELDRNISVNLYLSDDKFFNPAFDITPNELITGYITPLGILSADELETRLKNNR
jgi:S-methyl-5-thioribose-1-phosphate isomerase